MYIPIWLLFIIAWVGTIWMGANALERARLRGEEITAGETIAVLFWWPILIFIFWIIKQFLFS